MKERNTLWWDLTLNWIRWSMFHLPNLRMIHFDKIKPPFWEKEKHSKGWSLEAYENTFYIPHNFVRIKGDHPFTHSANRVSPVDLPKLFYEVQSVQFLLWSFFWDETSTNHGWEPKLWIVNIAIWINLSIQFAKKGNEQTYKKQSKKENKSEMQCDKTNSQEFTLFPRNMILVGTFERGKERIQFEHACRLGYSSNLLDTTD